MASQSSTPQKTPDQRSCETACSSNSSCFFQRRKPANPLASRSSVSRSTGNTVRQRVLSAKLLKLKSVQNQLNDANYHLAELIRENQVLKTLQKRQDRALSKYEGANAELPRLMQSHEEEIRFLTEKNKALRRSVKELNEQLKHRNEELQTLQEQLRHFERLDRDKRLLEREKLIEELEDVKVKLRKADEEIVLLNRKLALESKTAKQRLNTEMAKHKQCQKELAQALAEVGRLTKLQEAKEKNGRKRFSSLVQRQSVSMISLNVKSAEEAAPVTEVKLQPIAHARGDEGGKPHKGILKCPSENVRARLSADSRKDTDDEGPDKVSLSGSASSSSDGRESKYSRPNSSYKLEKIEMDLQNTIRKAEEGDECGKRLGNYCLKAVDALKTQSEVIDAHKRRLESAKSDTDSLLDTLHKVESVEKKLVEGELPFEKTEDDNLDFVTQILSEEAEFQRKHKDRNGNVKKEPPVNDKKKLLATLRAIDNGDSIDSFDSAAQKKNKLMQELFGDLTD